MYLGRKCGVCGHTRIQEQTIVVENKVKYVLYTCPICKARDIDRLTELPKSKLWNGFRFKDARQTGDDSFIEED